jgi:hypothetical protein
MLGRINGTNRRALNTESEASKFACLASLLPVFQMFPEVHRVILFGSRARRDHQERVRYRLGCRARYGCSDVGQIIYLHNR